MFCSQWGILASVVVFPEKLINFLEVKGIYSSHALAFRLKN